MGSLFLGWSTHRSDPVDEFNALIGTRGGGPRLPLQLLNWGSFTKHRLALVFVKNQVPLRGEPVLIRRSAGGPALAELEAALSIC